MSTNEQDPVDDALVARETKAAAAQAARIGGYVPHEDAEDPAMAPVYEAGGDAQDGWEIAEADLIDNATHGDGHGNPRRDAPAPEAPTSATFGESDHELSSEVEDDDR